MGQQRGAPGWKTGCLALGFSALASGLLIQPGCTDRACRGSGDPDVPSTTLECPAGELCYHGRCLRGCSAGPARLSCSAGNECDSSRPNCINDRIAGGRYCSVCDEGQVCVPALNVCQPLAEAAIPEEPARPGPEAPSPLYPTDASFTPTGLRPTRMAGPPPVRPSVPYTHAIFMDVAQELDLRAATPLDRGSITVRGLDLRPSRLQDGRWRLDRVPARWEPKTTTGTNSVDLCTFRRLQRPDVDTAPANIGKIQIYSSSRITPPSINGAYEATFAAGAYQVTRVDTTPPTTTLANPLLNLSVPDGQTYEIDFAATEELGVTAGPWPSAHEASFFVPFELVPVFGDGVVDLRAPVVVPAAPEDLTFRWEPIRSRGDRVLRVGIRIAAKDAEITCDVEEALEPFGGGAPIITDTITVPGSLLTNLRAVAGPGDYPLYFERTRRALLLAPAIERPGGGLDSAVTAEAWVRRSLIGTLRL